MTRRNGRPVRFVMPTLVVGKLRETGKRSSGVLHVVRYNRNQLAELIERVTLSGYGLTLELHAALMKPCASHRFRPCRQPVR